MNDYEEEPCPKTLNYPSGRDDQFERYRLQRRDVVCKTRNKGHFYEKFITLMTISLAIPVLTYLPVYSQLIDHIMSSNTILPYDIERYLFLSGCISFFLCLCAIPISQMQADYDVTEGPNKLGLFGFSALTKLVSTLAIGLWNTQAITVFIGLIGLHYPVCIPFFVLIPIVLSVMGARFFSREYTTEECVSSYLLTRR